MKLRYKIPFRLDLYAPDKRTTTIRTEFTHANLRCNMSLSGEKSRSFDDIEPGDDEDLTKIIAEIPTDQRWFKSVTHLQIEIEDVGKKRLETLVETRDFSKLYKLLRTLGNRCIRAFRNFGMIAEIREIPPGGEEKPEIGLRSWLVEIRKNGHDWEKLISGGGLREILRTLQPQRVPNFKPERWSMIEEAIQDDVAPDPEQEFTVNALEHLDSGNYRSAVMESIIALEITLTSFIREYLANYKGMSEQQINRFLSPNLTLDMRLAGVVQLMLDESELRMFHMDKILQAVHWRNRIVHKTGHLPEEP